MRTLLGIVGCGVLLVACGDDDRRGGDAATRPDSTVGSDSAMAETGPGSGSGVDSSKTVASLTPAEAMAVCNYTVPLANMTAGQMCMGLTLEMSTPADCVTSFSAASMCTATVAEIEACAVASSTDPCALLSQVCAPLLSCAQ
ncbi:MAG: hypothetical protein AAGF12_08950 [Myxococcota bacterium]